MNDNRIEAGDLVDVYFTTSESLFGVEVLRMPGDVGDCWILRQVIKDFLMDTAIIHNVILFEKMTLIKKGSRP